MLLVLLTACAIDNSVVSDKSSPGGFDTGSPPPFDTGTTDTDPADTGEGSGTGPGPQPPTATFLTPTADELVQSCDGATLTGIVSDPDNSVDELTVTWKAGDQVIWVGIPDADGTTHVDWNPGDGTFDVTLSVVDPTGLSGADAHAFSVAAPTTPAFTWSRSRMADRIVTPTVGTCIGAALALPTYTDWVWDDGDYTPAASAADGHASGRHWASWALGVGDPVDCHLFELEVDVPTCGDYTTLRLSSPWYDGVPINDNIYVYKDGVQITVNGTSYDSVHTGGPPETDSWIAPHVELPTIELSPGLNRIQIVAEEYAGWGGFGYLEPSLE